MLKIEEKLKRFPPCVCRLLARTGDSNRNIRLLEDEEIAERANIHVSKVRSIMWLTNWDSVTVEDLFKFSKACGIDFSDRESLAKHYKYTQLSRPFAYLRKHRQYPEIWSLMFRMYSEYLEGQYVSTE